MQKFLRGALLCPYLILTILIFERMKRNFKHGGYVPPFIEAECVCCESGFADSLLSYDETPSMPYGDDKEQWF